MDLKQLIETKIAAALEKEMQAKLHVAQKPQVKQEEEEIERPAPAPAIEVPHSSLVAKKRKRPGALLVEQLNYRLTDDHLEAEGRAANDVRAGAARSESPPGKKGKPSTNAAQSAKPSADARPENQNRFAPPPGASRGPGGWKTKEVIETHTPSEWYQRISTDKKTSNALNRGDVQTVTYVRTLITDCVKTRESKDFFYLRKRIHEMEFYAFLNGPMAGALIKKSKILEPDGLIKIFNGPKKAIFPWDIAADAEALYLRWMGGDLDPDLMRGIKVSKGVLHTGKKRTSYSLKKTNTKKRCSNTIGSNNLINGQWWPLRICALRDGAHGAQEAGIYGQEGKGAYSVVVAAGGYADRDNGEVGF